MWMYTLGLWWFLVFFLSLLYALCFLQIWYDFLCFLWSSACVVDVRKFWGFNRAAAQFAGHQWRGCWKLKFLTGSKLMKLQTRALLHQIRVVIWMFLIYSYKVYGIYEDWCRISISLFLHQLVVSWQKVRQCDVKLPFFSLIKCVHVCSKGKKIVPLISEFSLDQTRGLDLT